MCVTLEETNVTEFREKVIFSAKSTILNLHLGITSLILSHQLTLKVQSE